MLQITYISTARPELPAEAIDQILAASRRNNHADGITGLLLYDGYRFLQALEGEPQRVRRTFERITADPRHRAIVTLGSYEVTARSFGDWSMASQRVGIASGNTVTELVDSLTEEVADLNMQALFRSFARLRQAA
jgi:FAD-dependent sensor of blue light